MDCPICLEEIAEGDPVSVCAGECRCSPKKPMHRECFVSLTTEGPNKCPFCRMRCSEDGRDPEEYEASVNEEWEGDNPGVPSEDFDPEFYNAAASGDRATVEATWRGVNLNMYDGEQSTPLHAAVADCRDCGMVRLLARLGAFVDFPNRWGETPLWTAAQWGRAELVAVLAGPEGLGANVEHIPDEEERLRPVHVATHREHPEAVRALVEDCGADVDAVDIDGRTPLLMACGMSANPEMARLLLGLGADPNRMSDTGHTPLTIAAKTGQAEIVELLAGAGAEVNLRTPVVPDLDLYEHTPLWFAASGGHLTAAEALIGAGADVDLADAFGCTPVWAAAWKGHTEVVRSLAEHEADVRRANDCGDTPLQEAVREGHFETAWVLLMAAHGGARAST